MTFLEYVTLAVGTVGACTLIGAMSAIVFNIIKRSFVFVWKIMECL